MSDPTRFDLDERQRAMLAEMGIQVWWPLPEAHPAAAPDAAAAAQAGPAQLAADAGGVPGPAAAGPDGAAARPVPPARIEPSRPTPPRPAPARPSPPVAAPTAPSPAALPVEPLPPGIAHMDWPALEAAVRDCRACGLCHKRTRTVFGAGDRQARWMVVGEAPGEQEDLQGEPFVGQAGQLLDNMLKAIGLNRSVQGPQSGDDGQASVFITNTLKCRPPANRNPEPAELQTCGAYLQRQVALVQPRIILAMGRFAVQALLQSTEPLGKLRGRVHRYEGVPVVVTYHPAYLLRSPADKAKAWADLVLALQTAQGA